MFVSDELQVPVSKYKAASEASTKHQTQSPANPGIFDRLLGSSKPCVDSPSWRVENTGPDNSKGCTATVEFKVTKKRQAGAFLNYTIIFFAKVRKVLCMAFTNCTLATYMNTMILWPHIFINFSKCSCRLEFSPHIAAVSAGRVAKSRSPLAVGIFHNSSLPGHELRRSSRSWNTSGTCCCIPIPSAISGRIRQRNPIPNPVPCWQQTKSATATTGKSEILVKKHTRMGLTEEKTI